MIPSVLEDNVLFLFDVKWRTNDDAERLDGRDIRLRRQVSLCSIKRTLERCASTKAISTGGSTNSVSGLQ